MFFSPRSPELRMCSTPTIASLIADELGEYMSEIARAGSSMSRIRGAGRFLLGWSYIRQEVLSSRGVHVRGRDGAPWPMG